MAAAPFVLMAIGVSVSVWQVSRLMAAMRWVDHTDEVLGSARALEKLALDLETGVRGYLLTADAVYLEPYNAAQAPIAARQAALRDLVKDNPRQEEALGRVVGALRAWQDFAAFAMESPDAGKPESLELGRRGKTLMDAFRQQMDAFVAEEGRLRSVRSSAVISQAWSTLVSTLVAFLTIAAALAWLSQRQALKLSAVYAGALRDSDALRLQLVGQVEALGKAEATFRSLVESLPDGIIAHLGGRVVITNPALDQLLGYAPGALVGTPVRDLVHPADVERVDRRIVTVLRDGANEVAEVRMLHKDGKVVHVEACGRAITLNGELAVLARLHDLSDRHRMTAELIEVNRMAAIGTLAAGVGHEINNPLAYVASNIAFGVRELEAARKSQGEADPELLASVVEALQEAAEGAERIRNIVADLRGFARVDPAACEQFELSGPIDAALAMASNHLAKRAAVVQELGYQGNVLGNPGRLGQVLLNLFVNAAHAMEGGCPDKNRLTVRTAVDGDEAVIQVSDTGTGIPPENLTRLFEPFFTTKPVGVGTGLGLSISRQIMASMDGELQVASTVGQGTTFTLRLPMARALDGSAA